MSRLIDIDDSRNCYIGMDGEYETWNIDPNVIAEAQPEIIRCKDCKHYKAYEYTGKLACHYVIGGTVVRNLNDFCSRAEKEN